MKYSYQHNSKVNHNSLSLILNNKKRNKNGYMLE